MVAMNDVTDDGSIIFAKNSDRQTNEPLSTRYIPSSIYPSSSKVKTTYIEVDQVEETYSCVLFSPANIFGAEMGFNCHGLVVGNEALFTKVSSDNEGLTGMDLVRLVLERCRTSRQGKNEIVSLISKYGQGGNCGFTSQLYYHSSFLLVDSTECWIVETVGKDYAAKKITKGTYTISNIISFGGVATFDEYSENLIGYAICKGWCQSKEDFHFQKCYSGFSYHPNEFYNGFLKTQLACSQMRRIRSNELIHERHKKFDVLDMFHILRDHQCSQENPSSGLTNIDICMHAGFGPIRFNQTTGSLVSVLPANTNQIPTHYATCTSVPCLSVFKPIWLDSEMKPPRFLSLDDEGNLGNATCTFSLNSIWWKSEIITRNIMKYYRKLIKEVEIERDELERELVAKSKQLSMKNILQEERNQWTIFSFDKVDQLSNQWFSRSSALSIEIESELSSVQEFAWEKWRTAAQIPEHLLTYSKIGYTKNLLLSVGLLVVLIVIWIFLTNNSDQRYTILCLLLLNYVFIYQILVKRTKRKTNSSVELLRFNFND
ncbi:unnamed protein product [Adineta ricciae]|uniref:Uncharacterized protein n=1 Tax=Adineta ricciae TaxID=249248 RepID=A0A815H939_ADIRI|nr:unnamed protein product [Adineta ricciae]CAF1380746.1 unnamed protein product [Adineta ricciae]